jgi:hypothetical protein
MCEGFSIAVEAALAIAAVVLQPRGLRLHEVHSAGKVGAALPKHATLAEMIAGGPGCEAMGQASPEFARRKYSYNCPTYQFPNAYRGDIVRAKTGRKPSHDDSP